jgi:hypothetical protein
MSCLVASQGDCGFWGVTHIVQYLIGKYVFYMLCVYVCCLCRYNMSAKSWLALGCSQKPGCPWGGIK